MIGISVHTLYFRLKRLFRPNKFIYLATDGFFNFQTFCAGKVRYSKILNDSVFAFILFIFAKNIRVSNIQDSTYQNSTQPLRESHEQFDTVSTGRVTVDTSQTHTPRIKERVRTDSTRAIFSRRDSVQIDTLKADTLKADSIPVATPINYNITMSSMFGEQSSKCFSDIPMVYEPEKYSDNVPSFFNIATSFTIVFIYSYIVFRYSKILSSVFKFPFSKFSESNMEESTNVDMPKLLFAANIMFLISTVVLCANINRFGSVFTIDDFTMQFTTPIAILLVGFVVFYRFIMSWLMRWVTQDFDFFHDLRFKSRMILSFFSLIVSPVIMITIFSPDQIFGILKYLMIIILIIFTLFYIIRIYQLFNSKKVSLLQYILYFCAIDFIPISFIYTIAKRL